MTARIRLFKVKLKLGKCLSIAVFSKLNTAGWQDFQGRSHSGLLLCSLPPA